MGRPKRSNTVPAIGMPWMPLYIDQFTRMADGLSAAQVGFLIRLLITAWRHEARLPDDATALMRIAGARYRRDLDPVVAKLSPHPLAPGWLTELTLFEQWKIAFSKYGDAPSRYFEEPRNPTKSVTREVSQYVETPDAPIQSKGSAHTLNKIEESVSFVGAPDALQAFASADPARWRTWFANCRFEIDDDRVRVIAPSGHARDHIDAYHVAALERALAPRHVRVEVVAPKANGAAVLPEAHP